MVDLDTGADGVLAVVQVLEHHVAAGHLDVAGHHGRRVYAQLVAHEVDGAVLVDGDAAGGREADFQRVLHVFFRPMIFRYRRRCGGVRS